MTPSATSGSPTASRSPRVGIPWRTSQEERENSRQKLDYYFTAIRKAGAEPVEISLEQSPFQLQQQLQALDAFVLPGSPADVDPERYGAQKHLKTQTLDPKRDGTDLAILSHAFQVSKPVLAICYGCQVLNVYLKGTLIQDIPAETPDAEAHGNTDLPPGAVVHGDLHHMSKFTPGSRLARLSRAPEARINSSHHQAIAMPGANLEVTARASDGTVEGVEWTGDSNWVTGVQWHPERMDDAFSQRLFGDFVAAVRTARDSVVQKA